MVVGVKSGFRVKRGDTIGLCDCSSFEPRRECHWVCCMIIECLSGSVCKRLPIFEWLSSGTRSTYIAMGALSNTTILWTIRCLRRM